MLKWSRSCPTRTVFAQSFLNMGIRTKKAGFLLAKHKTLFSSFLIKQQGWESRSRNLPDSKPSGQWHLGPSTEGWKRGKVCSVHCGGFTVFWLSWSELTLRWWERCEREKVATDINQYKAKISERIFKGKGQLQVQPGSGAPQYPVMVKHVRGGDKK